MRIGVYSGSFDPVHTGHVSFALQAVKAANLDQVAFLPERQPRHKHGITHYAHRLAMLKLALRAHSQLEILELPDQRFFPKTVSRLNGLYPKDELFLLLGSDTVYGLGEWPHIEPLLKRCGLIIGLRGADQPLTIQEKLSSLPVQPSETHQITSPAPGISSRTIREALSEDNAVPGLLTSVKAYSRQHWLYKHV